MSISLSRFYADSGTYSIHIRDWYHVHSDLFGQAATEISHCLRPLFLGEEVVVMWEKPVRKSYRDRCNYNLEPLR